MAEDLSKKITEHAKALRELTNAKAVVDAESKELGGEISQLKGTLTKLMEEIEMSSCKVLGAGTVYLAPILFVKEKKEKHEEFIKWLDKLGLGDIAPRKMNPQTLKAFYKERLEENLPLPDDFVDVTSGMEARLRKG